jgi:hypothetical protein
MNNLKLLRTFLEKAMHDKRLAPYHISVYVGIFQQWVGQRFKNPMTVVRNDLMSLSKLNGKATYYRALRELHEFGYIEYFPGSNKHEQTHVKMMQLTVLKCFWMLLKFKVAA